MPIEHPAPKARTAAAARNTLTERTWTVLVATDLQEGGDEAVRQAADWSREASAKLVVCHAVSSWVGPPVADKRIRAALTARTESLVGDVPSHMVVAAGSPHSAVLEVIDDVKPDLVVIGGSTGSGLRRPVHGSTSDEIARYATCSVLVARPSPSGGPVVVGTDHSLPSVRAMEEGAALAGQRGVRLVIVHVVHLPATSQGSAAPDASEVVAAEQGKLRHLEQRITVPCETLVLIGAPGVVLAEVARERGASTVVIGPNGASRNARLFLGTEALHVVHEAPCSVLIARP
jgi:nucleotide-binding universal stress UspA family protein